MAKYGKLWFGIWSDDDFTALDARSQQLYCLLISYPTRTYAGVLPLTINRWARVTRDSTPENVTATLKALEAARFVVIDWDTEEVLIRTFIRNDEVAKQPNCMKSAIDSFEHIQSPKIRWALHSELQHGVPDDKDRDRTALAVIALVAGLPEPLEEGLVEPQAEGLTEGLAEPPVVVTYVSRDVLNSQLSTSNSNPQPPTGGAGGALVAVPASEAPAKPSTRKKGTRITDPNWMPQQTTVDRIKAAFPHITSDQIRAEHEQFICWATGSASRNAIKLDWEMTWSGWMRRELTKLSPTITRSTADRRVSEAQALKAKYLDAEMMGELA